MISGKYVSEIFGYPASNKSTKAANYRSVYICPFTGKECDPINKKSNLTDEKTGKLLLNHQSGACSAWYRPRWSPNPYPVIICPFRFREDNVPFNYIKNKFFNNKDVAFIPEIGLQSYGRADWIAADYELQEKDSLKINEIIHVEFQADCTTGTRELVKCVSDFYKGIDISKKSYSYGLNSKASIKGSSLQIIDKGFLFKRLQKKSIWILQDYLFIYLRKIFPFKIFDATEKLPKDKNIFFLVTKLAYIKDEDRYRLEIDKLYATTPEELKDSITKQDKEIGDDDIEKLIQENVRMKFLNGHAILL